MDELNDITYKNFTITYAGRYYVIVPGTTQSFQGFNFEGYVTLNNAKGAITKHLKAQGLEKPLKALQASNEGKSYAAMEIEPERAVGAVEGLAEALSFEEDVHLQDTEYAVHGYWAEKLKKKDLQSRNKREGHYRGKLNGADCRSKYPLYGMTSSGLCSVAFSYSNRKQKKLAAIRAKHGSKAYNNAADLFKAMGV